MCDLFELKSELDGTDLRLAIDTNLPDEGELSVSVSRTYYKVGRDEAYARDYFSKFEPVYRWRKPRWVALGADAWKADLKAHQDQMAGIGKYAAFEVARIEDNVEIRAVLPDYSWNMLIRASNPAFSCGRSPVSLEPLSIRLNRLKNRKIEPVINHFPARGTVTRRQIDFPVRNPHRFGPFHGPDASSVHYPGVQDTRASLFHNRFQSVAP